MLDVGKQGLDRLRGQGPWPGSAPVQHMTGFHRGSTDELMVVKDVENMCQRIPSPIDGRRGSSLLMLGIDTAIDFPTREAFQRVIAGRKEYLEIQRITGERVGGVMAPLHKGTKRLDGTGDGSQRSPRTDGLACFHPLHGLIIRLACGGLIAWRVAERHAHGPMAQELFHDRQGGPGIEPLGGKGTVAVHAASKAW